jgi:hypothetical protein
MGEKPRVAVDNIPRLVKPGSFIEEVVDVNEKINPPITELQILRLMNEYDIPKVELHRLALYVYGIKTNNPVSGRQDGVIPGVDLYVTTDKNKANVVGQKKTDEQIDLDSGRLAAFISRDEDTNYVWEDGQIIHENTPTGLFAEQFPKDEFTGRFYVRTDAKGVHNRVVINPRPFCSSGCEWCARAYGDRNKLLHEQLDKRLTTPQDLVKELDESKPFQKLGGFKDMKEINFVSGDFVPGEKMSQADYLIDFVKLAKERGFKGKWYYSGHQIFSTNDIRRLKKEIGEGTICYTLEHLERRKELMPIKGKVELFEVSEILNRISQIMGFEHSQYYLIAGIDSPETIMKWIEEHKDIALPQIHVFTPYAPSHYGLVKGSRLDQLENVLKIRRFILEQYGKGINSGSNRSLFPLGGHTQ